MSTVSNDLADRLEPPLVLFCPAHTSRSWPLIQGSGKFCVNVLADDFTAALRSLHQRQVRDNRRGVDVKAEAVERSRLFVRMALHEAPGLGHGHGPLGQQRVRLDTGTGLRLNQVTVTGKDYAKMVDFYSRIGLRQIVDSPESHYARFESDGGATFTQVSDWKISPVALRTRLLIVPPRWTTPARRCSRHRSELPQRRRACLR